MQSRRLRFNRVPEKVPEKVPGGFGAEPGLIQQGSGGKRFRRRFQQALVQSKVRFNGFRRRFNSGPEKVPEKAWEALVQSQVRFNRVSEKVPEKVPGGFGAGPGQVQRVQEEVPEKVAEKVPEKFVFLRFVCMHVHTGDLLCGCWGYHRSLFLEIVQEVLIP